MRLLGVLVAVAGTCALASNTQGGQDRPLDNEFLTKAAICHNAEIEISKVADKRSNSSPVKDFAAVLAQDHRAAYDKLGEVLKSRKVGVATGLEKETRDEVSRLNNLEGSEFDRAFLQRLIQEHKAAIAMYENQATNGKEADIRNYAKELLPTMRKHLDKAEKLSKTVGK